MIEKEIIHAYTPKENEHQYTQISALSIKPMETIEQI